MAVEALDSKPACCQLPRENGEGALAHGKDPLSRAGRLGCCSGGEDEQKKNRQSRKALKYAEQPVPWTFARNNCKGGGGKKSGTVIRQ